VSRRPPVTSSPVAWAPKTPAPRTPVTLDVRVVQPPTEPVVDDTPAPTATADSATTTARSTMTMPAPSMAPTTTSADPSRAAPSTTAPATPTTPADVDPGSDLAPRPENLPGSLMRLVRGVDGKGPRQSVKGLAGALDYVPDEDEDFGKSGAVLAAAKAERHLRQSIAFHDVSVGMASDWFREFKNAAEKGFRPAPADLDNPAEVTQTAIMTNFLKDPSSWDDEARRVLGPMLAATSLHSQDPVKRLALGNSANLGAHNDTQLRMSTIEDLLRRKDAGLSVRFAFEVDVHHDGTGKVTAVDILRTQFEKQLQEKIRIAIDDAVRAAAPAPSLIAEGKPFRSRWVFASTWFIDPPGCLAMPSDAMGAMPGVPQVSCGGTFDVTSEGVKTSSFEVQQKITAELLRVDSLAARP
jgi:hypothetical protein